MNTETDDRRLCRRPGAQLPSARYAWPQRRAEGNASRRRRRARSAIFSIHTLAAITVKQAGFLAWRHMGRYHDVA